MKIHHAVAFPTLRRAHLFHTASGKTLAGRLRLAALDALDRGDELVIADWDRATRSMWDGFQIIKAVINPGAAIKVLDRSYIDLTRRTRAPASKANIGGAARRYWVYPRCMSIPFPAR